MSGNELTRQVIVDLLKDMASEYIKSRTSNGDGVGAYVDHRYPETDQLWRAEKEKQVRAKVELAENIQGMAAEIADKCFEDILKLGIPCYYGPASANLKKVITFYGTNIRDLPHCQLLDCIRTVYREKVDLKKIGDDLVEISGKLYWRKLPIESLSSARLIEIISEYCDGK